MKRKISAGLVLAMLMLLLGSVAVAAKLGVFGQLGLGNANGSRSTRLSHLDEAATLEDVTTTVGSVPSPIELTQDSTDYDRILDHQYERPFELTIHQTYFDGTKLYYSYTLKATDVQTTFHEGTPTGFDEWLSKYPGMRYAEQWPRAYTEEDKAIQAWFNEHDTAYVVRDSFALGDGAELPDGTVLNILDSADERIDEHTIRGFQEVEVPEGAVNLDSSPVVLDFVLTINYGTTVTYQDETGVYRTSIRRPENRGYIDIPMSAALHGNSETLTATATFEDYAAEATLRISDVDVSLSVVFDAPAWAEDFKRISKDGMAHTTNPIMEYLLIADGQTLTTKDCGFGVNEGGQYEITMRYDLPASMERISIQPIYLEGYTVAADESILLR